MTPTKLAIAMVAMAAIAAGCTQAQTTQQDNGDDTMTEPEIVMELITQDYEAAVAKLGPPATQEDFRLSRGETEFRIELLNYYTEAQLRDAPPLMREATWTLSPESNLTIWFAKRNGAWPFLHYQSWHPEDDF
ncbi:hypothetical protein [Ruegeria sp. HKCCD8929]|uniref:hypothetical protein n=1 Tax=Ruegeria sp. HKCCD8929 TaxID=2683006 RepID=UPI00148A03F5|nr:hypothetical protein [Ruegeria sp. HKCCD8929]